MRVGDTHSTTTGHGPTHLPDLNTQTAEPDLHANFCRPPSHCVSPVVIVWDMDTFQLRQDGDTGSLASQMRLAQSVSPNAHPD